MNVVARPISAGLAALALVAASLVGAGLASAIPARDVPSLDAPQVTAQALAKKSFTVFGKLAKPQVAKYGNANGAGDLAVAQGAVADAAGKKVGTVTMVSRVVAPSSKKDAQVRDTQLQLQLGDGQIFVQAVNEDPKDALPKVLHIMPVTGGTGAYATARGTLLMRPVGDKYLMAYDIFVEKSLKSSTFTVDTFTSQAGTGDAPQGIGNVAMLRATGPSASYMLIATQVAGTASAASMESVDLQVTTASGSLFARSIVRVKGPKQRGATFAVLGGTGVYAGHRGELVYSADGKRLTARLASTPGSAKALTWFEDNGRSVSEASIPGGGFTGAQGYMFKTSNTKAKKSGDYFATLLAYDEIDGITPVIGMIEQEFSTGTMIITGMTLSGGASGTPAIRPVVGGTGDYGGVSGQASSLQVSAGVWKKSARIWR